MRTILPVPDYPSYAGKSDETVQFMLWTRGALDDGLRGMVMTRYGMSILLALAALLTAPVRANDGSSEAAIAQRMQQLETETQVLRGELQALRKDRQQLQRLPEVIPAQALMPPATPPPQPSGSPVEEQGEEKEEFFTLDELKKEMKSLVWQKGDFKITPYGAFWADMLYETSRTHPSQFTLWVPSEAVEGESAFVIDARRSRFGLDVEGPRIPLLRSAKSSGRVEIDFHGAFINENQPGIQLRHAYWQAKDEQFAVLIGQTWDVVSPLYPGTLNYAVGWDAGNIGFRRTQFRLDRYWHFSPDFLLTLQGSLNQDIATDFPTVAGIEREPADWPLIEGRLAATLGPRGKGCRPITVGVSGHIGETGFDFTTNGPPPANLLPEDDARFQTWSCNIDLDVPITYRLRFQGEFFTGENLSSLFGGIGQGVCPCNRQAISATGGWLDLRYDWTSRLRSYAGFGIDDPDDDDFLVGRTYNQFIFTNIVFDVTPKLTTGFEVAYWKTLYQEKRAGMIADNLLGPTEPGKSVVLEWMVQYGF